MARAAKLILEDSKISIVLGGVADGTEPDFDDLAAIDGIVKRVSIGGKVMKTSTKGAGDNNQLYRFHSNEQTLYLDTFVPFSTLGWVFANQAGGGGGATPEGRYIQISTKTSSTMTTAVTWIGVIEEWTWEGANPGAEQVERITVNLNPDYNIAA